MRSSPFKRFITPALLGIVQLLAGGLRPTDLAADVIHLKNGHTISADRAWKEGSQVRYQKNGGVYGIPLSLVVRIVEEERPAATPSADVSAARRSLKSGDPLGAIRQLQEILSRDPRSLTALQALIEAQLTIGDARTANDNAKRALKLDDRNARTYALLGDTLLALGDPAGSTQAYQRSLDLQSSRDVERKLEQATASGGLTPATGPRLRISYDGSVNEPLGTAVLSFLDSVCQEYSRRLEITLSAPITVVLQTNAEFHEDTRAPEWATGWNDGSIRVPAGGLTQPTPALLQILRHELAHSFVSAGTRGNCPTWIHEGIAQWLEGRDTMTDMPLLLTAQREERLISLAALEAPFRRLSANDAALAYAESLSAVMHIIRLKGERGIVRLLASLGDGLPSEEALVVSLALSYPELQASWEQFLRQSNRQTR
jgi:hypothetical protein